ncbi:MAG TPA: VWA domain-containing protein [Vicinamibacterales bacterium]|nr:VWA domain-containing protein [Vicinamibacterales bacterium]
MPTGGSRQFVARFTLGAALLALTVAVPLVARRNEPPQQPTDRPAVQPAPLPRFRAGANLVRLDAYVSADGQPVSDLIAGDFEVYEDDQPQRVESFAFVEARRPGPATTTTAPTPNSTQEQRAEAQEADARVFVLFLDYWHVGMDGSSRSAAPVSALLDKVVGPNDLVGIMTPDITPQNITLLRRGTGIEHLLGDVWTWGQRDRAITVDPREDDIKGCYPDGGDTINIAKEMIERRREQKTLQAIESMVNYLDGLREERKFVMLFSEGWVLFGRNDRLGRALSGQPPGGRDPLGVGIDGRVTTGRPQEGGARNFDWCERERLMLAYIDHSLELRQLAQRANRANVSFYPIDPRGLTPFDDSIGPLRPAGPIEDNQRLGARQNGLRELAEQTDGAWVLNTNNTAAALTRMLADTNSYYLLSYYSTNAKLDGRFRRITVRVKRPGVEVRARPGYLAPTEAEARAAGASLESAGGKPVLPPEVARALDAIVPGRGHLPVRIRAAGLADRVRAVVELDAATLKEPEWHAGGTLQVSIESDRGGGTEQVSVPLAAGQRSVVFEAPEDVLPPGRYVVRVEGHPAGGSLTIRASTVAVVGAANTALGPEVIAFRRGPTTGLAYEPTADPRFRRTERIRLEVPVLVAGAGTATGRVLTREAQALPLGVAVGERTDADRGARYVVADVTLAPLAQGDYVVEVQSGTATATFGFRVVP